MKSRNTSVYLSYLLRHHPEDAELTMDVHGWVSVDELIRNVNAAGKHTLTPELLKTIVERDNKGRYRFSEDGTMIRACQGHSIPWVEPMLTPSEPPEVLFHGTTDTSLQKILKSGEIRKMKRHAVHMQANAEAAWQSAERWHMTPVVIEIDAGQMNADGIPFYVSDNGVWCADSVPTAYIRYIHTREGGYPLPKGE